MGNFYSYAKNTYYSLFSNRFINENVDKKYHLFIRYTKIDMDSRF